ncbi:8150_t:CDS:1 [Acaulospora morrowiae]|uniref:8150_t:CDS:1 n=1 Tax=Acaulospora morrowiae TaxID=94023 RepID=A0A9N9ANP2_9GLOM|nr:8150_t:CDS:1 [Acaulospora morrowiae]
MRVYWRQWIIKEEFKVESLHECFNNVTTENESEPTLVYNNVIPSIPLTHGWDCFDFAKSIRLKPNQPLERTIYHSYWRIDLQPIGDKQLATLKSFFATQNANYSSLILWSNGDLSNDLVLKPLFERYPDRFKTLKYDVEAESKGTPIENSGNLHIEDRHTYLDGDLIRLLVLYNYGGVWFDMDSLFIRDLSPLLEHEWIGQWDCFLPEGFPFNGAFMRFRKKSPYVCELLSEIAVGPAPRKDSVDWGATLYYKIFRRLIQNGKEPFKIIPWCFTDPSLCHPSNSMPGAFKESEFDKERLLQVFAYHWHNQWNKEKGSIFRFLEQRNSDILGF